MSVFIKGMQMPEDCRECRFQDYGSTTGDTWCRVNDVILAKNFRTIAFDSRPDWCPLVELPEHHGRLIDANYLKEHLYTCATNGRPLHRMYQELDELLEAINDIPTIIEAEGMDE